MVGCGVALACTHGHCHSVLPPTSTLSRGPPSMPPPSELRGSAAQCLASGQSHSTHWAWAAPSSLSSGWGPWCFQEGLSLSQGALSCWCAQLTHLCIQTCGRVTRRRRGPADGSSPRCCSPGDRSLEQQHFLAPERQESRHGEASLHPVAPPHPLGAPTLSRESGEGSDITEREEDGTEFSGRSLWHRDMDLETISSAPFHSFVLGHHGSCGAVASGCR